MKKGAREFMEISSKQMLAFLGAMLLTFLCIGAMLFLYVVGSFDLSGYTLAKKESEDAFRFFGLLFILIFGIYIIYRYRISRQPYTAIGIALPLGLIFFLVIQAGNTFYKNHDYYQAFDRNIWLQSEFKPFKMAKTLMKKGVLLDLNKQRVCELLGDTMYGTDKRDYISYETDDGWELQVYIKDDKVGSVSLYQGGFDD